MTSLAGLPVYLDLASVLNLGENISAHFHAKAQGWTDEQIVMSLILLNLAGGESVEQLRVFVHALSLLPEGIKTVRLRSDTAG